MRSIQIIIVRLLLFFYLTSSYLSAIHIHKERLKPPADCKVCIVIKNLHGKDLAPQNSIDIDENNYYQLIDFQQQIRRALLLKGFDANAPPRDS